MINLRIMKEIKISGAIIFMIISVFVLISIIPPQNGGIMLVLAILILEVALFFRLLHYLYK